MTDAALLSLFAKRIKFVMTRRSLWPDCPHRLWRIPLIVFIDERTRCRRGIIPMMKSLNPSPRLAFILAALALILPAGLLAGMTPAEVMKYNTTSAYADNGDKLAQYNLGVCFSSGLGVKTDPAQAVAWWRKSAAQGFAPAMYNLGYSYVNGIGTKQDLALGVSWYRKSADLGHVPAMCNLGICYEDGVGIRADATEAMKWLGKAAAQGHVAATIRLDLMRGRLSAGKSKSDGTKSKGVQVASAETMRRDLAEFLIRAKRGDSEAQWRLGFIYEQGKGVPVDFIESAKWWRMAADQGHAGAQFSIGYCYGRGEGVPRDPVEAAKWFRKSAVQGNATAQRFLGVAFAKGVGVAKNESEAYAYFTLAESADQYAHGYLVDLTSRMTLEAISEGKRRVTELQVEIGSRQPADRTKNGVDKLEQTRKAKEAELLRKGA